MEDEDDEESSPSSEADSDGLSEVEVLGPGFALWMSQVQGLMLKRWLHHYRSGRNDDGFFRKVARKQDSRFTVNEL